MIGCVVIGVVTGFIYLSVLLFVSKDIDTVITSLAGPMLQIFYDATGNKAGAICLLMFPLVCLTVSRRPRVIKYQGSADKSLVRRNLHLDHQ